MKKRNIFSIGLSLGIFLGATPVLAGFSYQGLEPLTVRDCIELGTTPHADQPAWRAQSDTRPACKLEVKKAPVRSRKKPTETAKVPQK